eukprot:TRINITY_DN2622_c2_g1_i1.p1 TRINITY_DN2622_c2_g1~~TRINITY_DN2622_c2_g1_i1.p1  ORF type:complete len:205 (+),score=100.11 TRINITY_DN2622_c2_g1_i1:85-615(+)
MALDDKFIEQVFDLYDEDGSGAIDIDELDKAMRSVGLDIPRSELEYMLKKIDKDGNQTIEKDEFKQMVKKMIAQKDSPEEIENAYRAFGNAKGEPWDAQQGLDEGVFAAVHKKLGLPEDGEKFREFVAAAGGGKGYLDKADWDRVMSEVKLLEKRAADEADAAARRAAAPVVADEF